MAELVGYILTGPEGEIQRWGGVWGQIAGIPNPLLLPGQIQIHAAAVGEVHPGFHITEWLMDEPETALAPPMLVSRTAAALTVIDGEVTGIERSVGISGGFIDEGTAYIYFTEEEPDIDYVILPSDGFTKFTDHVELTRPNFTSIAFITQRVQ